MKQNELFNKCCENIDPKTREEVWKQMDKELGRKENRGNSSKIPSNSQKQTLEQAAKARKTVHRMFKKLGLDGEYIYNPTARLVARNAFRAGAEWQKKRNELTWEDVKTIVNIADSKLTHTAWDDITYPDEQKFYEEVLKEFNNLKNKEI